MIIALYVIVLILTIICHRVFKCVFEAIEVIRELCANFIAAETRQNKINKRFVTIMENDTAISKNLAERIAVLEKKLEEKDNEC